MNNVIKPIYIVDFECIERQINNKKLTSSCLSKFYIHVHKTSTYGKGAILCCVRPFKSRI